MTFGDVFLWLVRKPYGLVPRAYLRQIDTERRAWKRWCEQAEAKLAEPDEAQR